MPSLKPLVLAALLLLAPALAHADTPYVEVEKRLTAEQRHATGLDTLTPEQLALLNRLLREQSEAETATRPQPAASSTTAATAAAAAETERTRGPAQYIGLDDQPIVSRVKGTVSGWDEGTEFALENGQVWKVLKGHMKLREALQAPEVRVVPGVAGRWFLEVDEDLPKARVYRID
jgi:hypothetical protein